MKPLLASSMFLTVQDQLIGKPVSAFKTYQPLDTLIMFLETWNVCLHIHSRLFISNFIHNCAIIASISLRWAFVNTGDETAYILLTLGEFKSLCAVESRNDIYHFTHAHCTAKSHCSSHWKYD